MKSITAEVNNQYFSLSMLLCYNDIVPLVRPLKIGNVQLKNNLIMAPMAGYTDIAFRKICKQLGAGLTVTEMVSVRGLVHGSVKTKDLMALDPLETPSCVQLFGSAYEDFSLAAQKNLIDGFDIIDINMGCPMPKIVKNGEGSALLSTPQKAADIVKALVALGKTVTVKVRLGQKDKGNAVDFCLRMQGAGASAITLHGRTAVQLYSGLADWDSIAEVAAKMSIPVIGNGDIKSTQDALSKLKTYSLSGIMLGRGALANPNIFFELNNLCGIENPLVGDTALGVPLSLQQIMLNHLNYTLEHFSEQYTIHKLRKHFAYYLKGITGIGKIKAALLTASSAVQVKLILDQLPTPTYIYLK